MLYKQVSVVSSKSSCTHHSFIFKIHQTKIFYFTYWHFPNLFPQILNYIFAVHICSFKMYSVFIESLNCFLKLCPRNLTSRKSIKLSQLMDLRFFGTFLQEYHKSLSETCKSPTRCSATGMGSAHPIPTPSFLSSSLDLAQGRASPWQQHSTIQLTLYSGSKLMRRPFWKPSNLFLGAKHSRIGAHLGGPWLFNDLRSQKWQLCQFENLSMWTSSARHSELKQGCTRQRRKRQPFEQRGRKGKRRE